MMEINRVDVLREVTDIFNRYETALVTNDLQTLDELFWNSEHTIRYGLAEDLYGFAEIQNFRRERSPLSLARTLRRTVITTFGSDFATASTEFIRPPHERLGRQMQTWARFPEGWRVVAAHVSFIAA
jgi:hypothetical protein